MNTPIFDFVQSYAKENSVRLHMPGHKGDGPLGIEKFDLTETEGADVLYTPRGIIAASEKNASKLFGTEKTVYSTEGSTLCIKAMVQLISLYAKNSGKKAKILAYRNAHASFMRAAGLLDVEVDFIYPESADTILTSKISKEELEKILDGLCELPTAVYITSPDYLGNILDVCGIAEVCHKHGILLAVDNAHGAYLAFLKESRHPIALGADVCCDSAHKTLSALTPAAYLHISKNAPKLFKENADLAMSLFATSSPSYLILSSLDLVNVNISSDFRQKLDDFASKMAVARNTIKDIGLELLSDEPTKLTLMPKSYGYKAYDLADILRKSGIVCEFADEDYIVFMFSPYHPSSLDHLVTALKNIKQKKPIITHAPILKKPMRAVSLRDALLSSSVAIPADESIGRVVAHTAVSCPPAIPIVIPGEVIDRECIEAFKYYGISEIRVIERNN